MAAEGGQIRDHDGDPRTAAEGMSAGLGKDVGSISGSAVRFGQDDTTGLALVAASLVWPEG